MFEEDDRCIERLIMSDEAHFKRTGYANKQNTRLWAEENPEQFHQRPLNSECVSVVFLVLESLGRISFPLPMEQLLQ